MREYRPNSFADVRPPKESEVATFKLLTPETITTAITIAGNPVAAKKFYRLLNVAVRSKADTNPATLTRLLLELVLDNEAVDLRILDQLLRLLGVKIRVAVKYGPGLQPSGPDGKMMSVSSVRVSALNHGKIGLLIKKLLELLVQKDIVSSADAQSILVALGKKCK